MLLKTKQVFQSTICFCACFQVVSHIGEIAERFAHAMTVMFLVTQLAVNAMASVDIDRLEKLKYGN